MSDIDQTHLIFTLECDQNTLVANFGPYLPLQLNNTATSILVAADEAKQAVIDANTAATQSAQYTAAAQGSAGSASTSASQSLSYSNIAKSQADNAAASATAAASSAVDAASTAGSITSALAKFAPVATSGSYFDLTNKPSIPAAQVNADWNAASGIAQILNKPAIPAAPVNADWNSNGGLSQILNKPIIPAAQINSDWNATSGVSQLLNKPVLSAVAISGSYNDLANKPSIPPSYSLPIASASVLGGIKVGSNLTIDSNGVLSATASGGVTSFNLRTGAVSLTADDVSGVGAVMYDTSSPTKTLTLAVPSVFNGAATYNNVSTFGGEAVFNNTTTYNSSVAFNSAITFANQVTVNGTISLNNTTTINGPVTFNTNSVFNTAPTMYDPLKVTSGGTGVNVIGSPGQTLIVNATGDGMTWASAPLLIQGGHAVNAFTSQNTTSLSVDEAQLNLGLMAGLVGVANGGTGLTALGQSGQVLSSNGSRMQWADVAANYTLPTATKTSLGGVKIGNGLSIDATGLLSATSSGGTVLPDQTSSGGYFLSTDGVNLHWSPVTGGSGSSGYSRVVNLVANTVLDSSYANALIVLQTGITSITLPPSSSLPIGSTISILSLTNADVAIGTDASDAAGVFPSVASAFDFNVFTPITAQRGTKTVTLWEGISYSNAFSPYWNQIGTSALAMHGGNISNVNSINFSNGTYLSTGTLGIGDGGTGLTDIGDVGQVLSVNADASSLEYVSLPYDISIFIRGKPLASEVVYSQVCCRPFTWPASLLGSYGTAATIASSATTFNINRNGTLIGSLSFAASAKSATFVFNSQITFSAGDVIQIVAPASQDATLANIAVTLAGSL